MQVELSQLDIPAPCECVARILVVDDTPFNILAVKNMVKLYFKMEVEEAINGQIALDMFKEGYSKECKCSIRAYRLIFMDVQMPIMGGIESAKEIMSVVGEENLTTIVALTSFTN